MVSLWFESAAGHAAPSPVVGHLFSSMLDDVFTREESSQHFLIRLVAAEAQAQNRNGTVLTS